MVSKAGPGKIVAITGPMFSGKTSTLIALLEREMLAGRRTILFKPKIDTRYSRSYVTTHKGVNLPATPVGTDSDGVSAMLAKSRTFQVVGVDEAQFWAEESRLAEALDRLAYSGKTVYVSMLNRDHKGDPFGSAVRILALAEQVHSLTAICPKCGAEATFTQRVLEGKEVFGELIQIGGKESYEPRCRACFVGPDKGGVARPAGALDR